MQHTFVLLTTNYVDSNLKLSPKSGFIRTKFRRNISAADRLKFHSNNLD